MRSRLALQSLWNRRLAVALTMLGIALSTAMIVGVERIRVETRESFTSTISGTDLIVGARTGPVQLLLTTVFRIGDASNSVRWESFEKISRHPHVAWAIPISLGDSHRGFRVMGTTAGYFEHFRYGSDQSLRFASGRAFDTPLELVLGAQVAAELGYQLNDQLTIAHGTRDDGLSRHETLPFTVVGILAGTGTPADRTLHSSLAGIEAIHSGWESGVPVADASVDIAHLHDQDLQPEFITAFLLGLQRRSDVLQFQQAINKFPSEPLLAILPGMALRELWALFSAAERALVAVAVMTVITGLLGMMVGIFSTLNERRREMAVLRAVGARPLDIFGLLVTESVLLGLLGAVGGYLLLTLTISLANAGFAGDLGLQLSTGLPDLKEATLLLMIVMAALVAGMLPAWRACRLSLHDGLSAG